ncbi:hypothetical protein PPMP20_26815 [Paraburkholderia phymatum]|uniref:Uncharacterized protein n=1 Tax=Paraburkholderia phymatum (strain DSM 17167 / CIP 108236 / LMG 21445 / STM815) TaxID=391038 RepID=B2JL01_PARP8|nr:hypothetical protein [Paraburkholderia phymatum]ACC72530.1 hypothetical protein Bphy_3376 [Paraburkholderia phymatum STM815]
MKTTVFCIAFAAAAVAVPAHADQPATPADKVAFCKELANTTGKIVKARNAGVPMQKLMGDVDKQQAKTPGLGDYFRHQIRAAYSVPRNYITPEQGQQAAYDSCVEKYGVK